MNPRKSVLATLVVLGAIVVTLAARPAFAQQEKDEDEKSEKSAGKAWPPSAPKATISPVQAMAVAKKKMGGGTAFQATFEFDEGHWVYGVMVVKGHKISEVEIDPVSGKALDTEAVSAEGEAKEMSELLKKVAASGG